MPFIGCYSRNKRPISVTRLFGSKSFNLLGASEEVLANYNDLCKEANYFYTEKCKVTSQIDYAL